MPNEDFVFKLLTSRPNFFFSVMSMEDVSVWDTVCCFIVRISQDFQSCKASTIWIVFSRLESNKSQQSRLASEPLPYFIISFFGVSMSFLCSCKETKQSILVLVSNFSQFDLEEQHFNFCFLKFDFWNSHTNYNWTIFNLLMMYVCHIWANIKCVRSCWRTYFSEQTHPAGKTYGTCMESICRFYAEI